MTQENRSITRREAGLFGKHFRHLPKLFRRHRLQITPSLTLHQKQLIPTRLIPSPRRRNRDPLFRIKRVPVFTGKHGALVDV
jgi:hypothetical protein